MGVLTDRCTDGPYLVVPALPSALPFSPQDNDRRKLHEAGCSAVFEPTSLYAAGETLHLLQGISSLYLPCWDHLPACLLACTHGDGAFCLPDHINH